MSLERDRPGELRASIVIPTYNRRELLLRTLSSLERQDVPADAYEVVVGVDGSTDGTVEALAGLHPPYRLRWTCRGNRGAAAATNSAAALACHEVLIFLDDDQIASEGMVRAHLEAHRKHGDVFVQGLYPMAPGYCRVGASMIYERSLLASLAPIDRVHTASPHVWSANISVRRSTWARVGRFDESFREYGGEDTDFGFRVHALKVPLVFDPAAYSEHLHVITHAGLRHQAYSEGRSIPRLAEKHGRPLAEFVGRPLDRTSDFMIIGGWKRAPRAMGLVGILAILLLKAADRLRITPLQLLGARFVHRLYKLGGMVAAAPDLGSGRP